MSAGSSCFRSALLHALVEERHFALSEAVAVALPIRLARNRLRSGTRPDPCISSVSCRDHDSYFELLGEEERDTQSMSVCSGQRQAAKETPASYQRIGPPILSGGFA
jgi:hypothetical protein